MRKIILAALALALVGCFTQPKPPAEPPTMSDTADMDLSQPGLSDLPSTPSVTNSPPGVSAAPPPAAAVPSSAAPAVSSGY